MLGGVVIKSATRELRYSNNLPHIAESTTSHGKLLKIDPILIVGSYVYPRFVYSTGDSMLGQQVAHGDAGFFVFGVARQANDFHAVQ